MPKVRATSDPGAGWKNKLAAAAVSVLRQSIDTIMAPSRCAWAVIVFFGKNCNLASKSP